MTKKFAPIKTLTITQYATIKDGYEEKGKSFAEIVFLRSPYFFGSKIPRQPGRHLIIHSRKGTLRIVHKKKYP
jgi:hypothetical protein